MNKGFITKMIQSKILAYEAIKEIMPDKLRDKIQDIEKESLAILKEAAFSLTINNQEENKKPLEKSPKKIKVDFN